MASGRLGIGAGVWRPALAALLAAVLAVVLATAAAPQAETRAEPITGPDVVTIGNVARDDRVNLRSGPATMFPVVTRLPWGTRVNRKGPCVAVTDTRWCPVRTADGRHEGYVNARFLVEGGGGDDLAGGPDYWQVHGLPRGDRLNVRREPSAQATALATLGEGEVVRNLGCRMAGTTRWCRIRSTTGMDVTGWVAGRYLREAAAPPSGGGGSAGSGGTGASGPDGFVVTGLAAGDLLNLRAEPTTSAPVLARLMAGDRVQNLGCRAVGQARWCRVRTLVGPDVTGWANARYLREG